MYEPSRQIASFHVAGFQYHDGALVLDQMKVGMPVELVPERDNPYDPNAMALCFKGTMVGYVPREENALLSLLAFYGHGDTFEARIIQVSPDLEPWNQVRVVVFVTDKR